MHARRRRSKVTVGWASPIDIQSCSCIVAAWAYPTDRPKIKTRRIDSVFLRILRKRQRAVTSTYRSTFSSQSEEESFSSRLLQSLHEWLGSTFGCAVAVLTLTCKSWIPGARKQAEDAPVSWAHAQGLFWCEHVDRSPTPYCKKKTAGTFFKKCRHYTLHRCTKMEAVYFTSTHKNVGGILYIDVKNPLM